MTQPEYPSVPPPPLPSLKGYIKPALVSAGVAGAGYGVGYIAGVLATSALAGHPGAARKLFGATPAVRARNFDRMADLAGKASGVASGVANMAAEGYRREKLWEEWARQTGRPIPTKVSDGVRKVAAMCEVRR